MRIVGALSERMRREMHRGRGSGKLAPFPIPLEPPFSRFDHDAREKPATSSAATPTAAAVTIPLSDLSFLKVRLSAKDGYSPALGQQLVLAFSPRYHLSFEVIGHGGSAYLQFVSARQDASNVVNQLNSHYPRAQAFDDPDRARWDETTLRIARSYRLRDSHLFQIKTDHRPEVYIPLVGVLAGLRKADAGMFQVLFQPVRHPWRNNIIRLASDPWDPSKSAFVDLPDLPRRAQSKVERPLFAVTVRLAATSRDLLDQLEGGLLSQLESVENGLVALASDYPLEAILGRFTQTSGILLNAQELAALVHMPDPGSIPVGLDTALVGAPAPRIATEDTLAPVGSNFYRGAEVPVGISEEQLTRHVAILGGTGSGKTNLMKVAFGPLLEQGYGMAILDPKGDLAQGFLDLIPEHRVDDVVWFDPTDREHPPALNVLDSSSELSDEALTAELMVGLRRLFRGSSEFGPRMEWVLRNAVSTLLNSQGEKTLHDIPRFLEDSSYRTTVLATVRERELREFWERRQLTRTVIDPVLNRLSSFLDRPTIRNTVAQPNRIDFHKIMRERKIFIANLERGQLQDAAFVLGSFILSRLQLAALARKPGERTTFPFLVDEFHSYAGQGMDTESIQTFLTEARSYRAPLIFATQYVGRLNRDVTAAIFGTVGTMVCMHLGQIDAQFLQRELGQFTAEDLLNLKTGETIVRMGSASEAFNARTPLAEHRVSSREAIITQSRERYCRPRVEVLKLLETGIAPESPELRSNTAAEEQRVFVGDTHGLLNVVPSQDAVAGTPKAPTHEVLDTGTDETAEPQAMPGAPAPKEDITYLEHVVYHPFLPSLQRDRMLALSKYKGATIRQRLLDGGLIRLHKVSTGKRSGQLVLLEVTERGYELLGSMRIRADRPKGRGGFLHKYYAYKLKEYAEATWPGCLAKIEDASHGRPVDVSVQLPVDQTGTRGRIIAFEVYVTGESKEIKGIARDVQLFDQVIVCAGNPGSLDTLKARAVDALGDEVLKKVTFSMISQYLITKDSTRPAETSRAEDSDRPPKHLIQHLSPKSPSVKSGSRLELEPEHQPTTRAVKRGRKPKTPLLKQVEEAYTHLHDLDWLHECRLAELPEVRERIDPRHTIPEAQALRSLLLEAARQVIAAVGSVPDKSGVTVFLERYLEGKPVTEIARELGVSREWVSRAYRREALALCGRQFVRLVSVDDSRGR